MVKSLFDPMLTGQVVFIHGGDGRRRKEIMGAREGGRVAWTALTPKSAYGWISGGGSTPYVYPETNSDPNVVGLWYLDEASGNIVDEISGITLAKVGSPTYSVNATGLFTGVQPGITFGVTSTTGFSSTSAITGFDLQQTFVFEWYASIASSGFSWGYAFVLHGNDGAASAEGILAYINDSTTTSFTVEMTSDDATTAGVTFTNAIAADDAVHKYRLTGNRAGNLELFVDGVSKGAASIAGLSGKAFTNSGFKIGHQYNGGSRSWPGTIYTFRYTNGNNSNNLGGPGGG